MDLSESVISRELFQRLELDDRSRGDSRLSGFRSAFIAEFSARSQLALTVRAFRGNLRTAAFATELGPGLQRGAALDALLG